ncbi:MAG: hypothetical protein V1809_04915, partial [Planctomycetota bacterium]
MPLEYRIAETPEDIEGAVRLVYRNYREIGSCGLNHFEIHFYLHDVLPQTRTLVAAEEGRIVATLTLVFDSPLGVPSGKLYPAEVESLRSAGRRPAEISKLAVQRELGARGLSVLKGLFRLAWLLAAPVRGMTDIIILIEPRHDAFYRRSLLFERIGEQKPDPDAAGVSSLLLRLDLETARDRYRAEFGESPSPHNAYWYGCLDPEVPVLQAAAHAADARLAELNRRIESGAPPASLDAADRRYLDYRLFILEVVASQTCREAERRSQRGLFREEITLYERLLTALPPSHAPERQAGIRVDLAWAACHGGFHDKALGFARAARRNATRPDLIARSHGAAGLALYFMGQ